MQKELESRMISLIRNPKVFDTALKMGITSDNFVMFDAVFSFYHQYYVKYNAIPSDDIITATFPDFTIIPDVHADELKFISDEIVKSSVQRRAIQVINEASARIIKDPYGAIEFAVAQLSNARKKLTSSIGFTDKDAMLRYDMVKANKDKIAKGFTIGIKTGISLLDTDHIGWQEGDLIIIGGRLGMGKSFLSMYLGGIAWTQGKRVLYISPEMTKDKVAFRFDPIVGRMMGYDFSNRGLKTGDINMPAYKEFLAKVQTRADWLTVDSNYGVPFTIASIMGMVNQYTPDMLIIDGLALLQGSGGADWDRVKKISYDIKTMTQDRKIVTVATSQINRPDRDTLTENGQVDGEDTPSTDRLSYSDAVGQAADVVILMSKKIAKPDVRYITLPKRRDDEAINKPIEIKFDVDRGIIGI
jgi:replicative DNA helicase